MSSPLIRRVFAAAFLVAPALAAAQPARTPTRWDTVAHDLFRELIEINTTESAGSTLAAAQAMAVRLRAAGFPDSDVAVLQNAPRKGTLVARLRARNPTRKPLLLLSHLDVVEAKPEDWTLPPFEFIEKDSMFYGRGTSDNKDDTAIHLAILMRLRAENFPLDRDIIVAATADEEGGGANGVAWLIANHRDLIDAEYGLNEGGSGRVRGGKKLSHDVQLAEKKFLNFTLTSTNPGGHSSRPVKDNAITHLAEALVKVGAYDFPVHLNDVTRAYFTQAAAFVSPEMGAAMRAVVANPGDARAAAIVARDPSYNAQMRTTCVATMLSGGHATNALPQTATANVNCRILPDETREQVQGLLVKAIDNPKVTVRPAGNVRNAVIIPLPGELRAAIERATTELWPGVPVIPTMGTGATDGSRLRNAGIPTFGVGGQFYGDSNAHGMNERIPQRAFYEGMDFMYRLVQAVSRRPNP